MFTATAMSNLTKTYFLAPTWDYPPPPAGPIRLGNLIASPAKLVPALYTARDDLGTEEGESFRMEKRGVTWSREELRAGKFGVWTEFLSFLGLGVSAGVERERRWVSVPRAFPSPKFSRGVRHQGSYWTLLHC